jgi:hypothetical protein
LPKVSFTKATALQYATVVPVLSRPRFLCHFTATGLDCEKNKKEKITNIQIARVAENYSRKW